MDESVQRHLDLMTESQQKFEKAVIELEVARHQTEISLVRDMVSGITASDTVRQRVLRWMRSVFILAGDFELE